MCLFCLPVKLPPEWIRFCETGLEMISKLQHASGGYNLVVLRVDTGHGMGKPLSKTREEMADI
jgi:hypothetical protein